MAKINKNLVLLKLLLFTFYGALSCLMTFLVIHMRFLGLSIQDLTWINSVLPLASLIGPPLVGMLADKLGHYRIITIIFLLLATFLHTALLFVPTCNESASGPESSAVTLHCSIKGATLRLHSCPTLCPEPSPMLPASFQMEDCYLSCPEISTNPSVEETDVKGKSSGDGGGGVEVLIEGEIGTLNTTTADSTTNAPRDLLMQLRPIVGPPEYIILGRKTVMLEFNRSIEAEAPQKSELKGGTDEEVPVCEYPVEAFMLQEIQYSSVSCYNNAPGCEVICSAKKMGNDTQLLEEQSCCDHKLTLWLYFSVRALAEMCAAVIVSLLEAVALTMVHQHKGDYGREKMFGLIAVAIFPPLCGYLVDTEVGTFGIYSYAPVFYVFVALMLVTCAVTLALPIEVQVQRRSLIKNFIQLAKTGELSVLFLLMMVLGTFWGYLKTFVYLYLEDLNATKLLIGLTSSLCILPSLPFLYKSAAVVQYCGHHYLIMLAFVGYCIRFAGLSNITNPWWVLPLEALELFTLNLLNVSAATLAYKLAPKTIVATAQALIWVSHFNIGRCIGTFFGGQLTALYGDVPVFQGAAVLAALCAAIYLAVHQLLKYLKARREARPKPPVARENGNIANGHYTPLQMTDERF